MPPWPPPLAQVPTPPASSEPADVLVWVAGLAVAAVVFLFGLYTKSQADRLADSKAQCAEWTEQARTAVTATTAAAEANRRAADALDRQSELLKDAVRRIDELADAVAEAKPAATARRRAP